MPVLAVVHEDERLLALCKPSGQPTIPGRGEIGEPLSAAAARRAGAPVFVVHRLDRDASGLVVFAKDARTHRGLSGRFEARLVAKTYLAAVLAPLSGEGEVRAPIKQFGSGRMGVGAGGKPSCTRWKALRRSASAALLAVFPETGRRHQIRVHLYSLGHPVLGDPLYGAERPVGGARRLMLHGLELDFGLSGIPRLRAEPGVDFALELSNFSLAGPYYC